MTQPGYFEARAIAAQEKRTRERDEFSADEIKPIEIVEMTKADIANAMLSELKAILARNAVIFLVERESRGRSREDTTMTAFGMISSISWAYLIEVSKVLSDTRLFKAVDRDAIARELGLPKG